MLTSGCGRPKISLLNKKLALSLQESRQSKLPGCCGWLHLKCVGKYLNSTI